MKSLAVSEFRRHLLKILKEIENGASITITSRGRPVAKLVPPDNVRDQAIKRLKEIGKKAIIYDVLSPIDEKWEVME